LSFVLGCVLFFADDLPNLVGIFYICLLGVSTTLLACQLFLGKGARQPHGPLSMTRTR
jgi:hypothetical protein